MTTKSFFEPKNCDMKKIVLATLLFITTFTSCNGQNAKLRLNSPKENQSMNVTPIDLTGQLMNEDDFWQLIEKSRADANNNYQNQIESLKSHLLKLESSDIEKFDNRFTALLSASYTWKLWGAAYVINGGCSDDCFDYFRHYLIGYGRDKFYQTLKDPESCANWIKSEEEDNWEGLRYSSIGAYRQKTGRDLPKSFQAKFELKGEEFDEETVFRQYPKLAKKFAGEN